MLYIKLYLLPYVYFRLYSQDVRCYNGCYIEADGKALCFIYNIGSGYHQLKKQPIKAIKWNKLEINSNIKSNIKIKNIFYNITNC